MMHPTGMSTAAEATLRRLADALDCPVEAFRQPASGDMGRIVDLLRLWCGIVGEGDRAKVLAFMATLDATRRS